MMGGKRKNPDQTASAPTRQRQTQLSFSAPTAGESEPPVTWSTLHSTVIHGHTHPLSSSSSSLSQPPLSRRIVAFDFDDTIAGVDGTHVMAKSGSDWRWLSPAVPRILRHLHRLGFSLVVVSNQLGALDAKGLTKSGKKQRDSGAIFRGRVENVVRALHSACREAGEDAVPLTVFAATADDVFRKPRHGLWAVVEGLCGDAAGVDLANCVYVGDAAGRHADNWSHPMDRADHSDTDAKYAMNAGIQFVVPEAFWHPNVEKLFAGLQPGDAMPADLYAVAGIDRHPEPAFNPRLVAATEPAPALPDFDTSGNTVHLLLCVGPPAAGKSRYVTRNVLPALPGIVYANQDTLKTRKKVVDTVLAAVRSGSAVVVDNTNPTRDDRESFISAARSVLPAGKSLRVTVLWFAPDGKNHVQDHCNVYRALRKELVEWMVKTGKLPPDAVDVSGDLRSKVPGMVARMYWSKMQEPVGDDGVPEKGVDEVVRVPFTPEFDSAHEEWLWRHYYV
ncbi:polynucleotide kinase 3 phosphatase-domain-containing protein [Entophlyctis helioformis]|nr:polynucleotide kinase 3 phosphatase-domain-containing protein [Entophlyctis helioformis]